MRMYIMIGILKSGKEVVLTESPDREKMVKELERLSMDMMDPTVTKYVFTDDTHVTAVKEIASAYIKEEERWDEQ